MTTKASERIAGQDVQLTVQPVTSGRQGLRLSGQHNIWLQGQPGATLTGNGQKDGLVVENCHHILITGIEWLRWHDLRILNSDHIEARDCKSHDGTHDLWLWSGIHTGRMYRCEGRKTADSHCLYLGNWGNNINQDFIAEDCIFEQSGRAVLQVNAETGGAAASGMVFRRCRVNGSFAVNLLSVTDAIFDDCRIQGSDYAFKLDRAAGKKWPATARLQGGDCSGKIYDPRPSRLIRA